MSKYHFNLADGSREPDEDGTELADIQVARLEAIRLAAEVAHDRAEAIWADGSFQVQVTNEEGLVLLLVTMIVTNAPAVSQSQLG